MLNKILASDVCWAKLVYDSFLAQHCGKMLNGTCDDKTLEVKKYCNTSYTFLATDSSLCITNIPIIICLYKKKIIETICGLF